LNSKLQDRLPAINPFPYFPADDGLLSYSIDAIELPGRAASYVDRILSGEKPANLPVQQPSKFKLTVNLKTAKTLGLTIPQSLLARADEVIESLRWALHHHSDKSLQDLAKYTTVFGY
jgi:putative tryptophan/tyrosine transport system substrate-binding protein